MIEHELPLDENLGESFPAMKFDFPYIWFWGVLEDYIGGHVPWHWHEEPEFCHVIKGEVEYHLPEEVLILKEGDGIYINSNVLHMICPHNGCTNAIILPQIFNKLLLTGYHRSAIDTKYYRPIINRKGFLSYFLNHNTPEQNNIIRLLNECYKIAEAEQEGYEIQVRNYISTIWMELFNEIRDSIKPSESLQDLNNTRLIQMLNYINDHFAEKITLQEIADSACISKRECIRCFKKCIQTTPFQYLLEYRIDVAANMLLHTEDSITEIALQTGFETSSYFSRNFKQYMQCTPKQYRDTSRTNVKLPSNSKTAPGIPLDSLKGELYSKFS